ncbi:MULTISPECIES: Bug family tripartite tricarboxylate transporter substrate binding protein [unclassified Cupriavidus]|jgi:tripartite-type tricarboxylate transporter receptor subunit TctC|uniref:Bug family tripartite tricarboxylate transporter substrate binding protein n=1 Tax=unclassified Cupriavidus TaxID=2640874 RepID=UPI000B859383|nr:MULTISPECIES: tripartite tricarboxylate transporter substrate binding protein [unclassified Cupriavidus]
MMLRLMMYSLWTAALLTVSPAQAAYPDRPIVLVVPFAAGGPADVMARTLAKSMTTRIGQTIVVENRPGAGGLVGISGVTRATADGYTLGMAGTGAMVYAPFISPKMPFDPLKDVAYLSTMVSTPNLLVVNASSPFKSVADLQAAAKREPEKFTVASAGVGSSTHVVGALFQREAGIRLRHVPYKGGAPAVQDLMGGQVDMFIAEVPAVAHLIKGGKLRALMVTDTKRLAALPDVPTAAEAGLPKVLAAGAYGIVAPRGLPDDVSRKIVDAVTAALRTPDLIEKFAEQGGIAQSSTPDAYRALIKSEQGRWGPVIKAAGITAE